MLKPSQYAQGDILAIDRAYIDYAKFEELTRNGVVYVTKMKKNLNSSTLNDTMFQNEGGLMVYRVREVVFTKRVKDGEDINHHARIITYVDIKKTRVRLISLFTRHGHGTGGNCGNLPQEMGNRAPIQTTEAELPLRYFYGESAMPSRYRLG